jgi:ubiquinone/menaquinone biosynthesis C-methylase UbiE
MFKTDAKHKRYWKDRKIDWGISYFDTWNHPHRHLIVEKLRNKKFGSVFETGCASGPNLYLIKKVFPHVELGGIDLSADAIQMARERFSYPFNFEVGSAEKIFLSDKSVDVSISDMCMIYLGKKGVNRALNELKRITRNFVILCEFHSESPLKNIGLKLTSGYNSHNYRKILEELDFYDIIIDKIPDKAWPKEDGTPADPLENSFRYIITARI